MSSSSTAKAKPQPQPKPSHSKKPLFSKKPLSSHNYSPFPSLLSPFPFRLRSVPWSALVVDEAHKLKNAMSKARLAVDGLRYEMIALLTGTPMQVQHSFLTSPSLTHPSLPSPTPPFPQPPLPICRTPPMSYTHCSTYSTRGSLTTRRRSTTNTVNWMCPRRLRRRSYRACCSRIC